jgi:hypothetical protein
MQSGDKSVKNILVLMSRIAGVAVLLVPWGPD